MSEESGQQQLPFGSNAGDGSSGNSGAVTAAAPDDDGREEVFSKTIRLKNGKVLVAAHYGLKAFRFMAKRRRKAS